MSPGKDTFKASSPVFCHNSLCVLLTALQLSVLPGETLVSSESPWCLSLESAWPALGTAAPSSTTARSLCVFRPVLFEHTPVSPAWNLLTGEDCLAGLVLPLGGPVGVPPSLGMQGWIPCRCSVGGSVVLLKGHPLAQGVGTWSKIRVQGLLGSPGGRATSCSHLLSPASDKQRQTPPQASPLPLYLVSPQETPGWGFHVPSC